MKKKLFRQLASIKEYLNEPQLDQAFNLIKESIAGLEETKQPTNGEVADFAVPMAYMGKNNTYLLYSDGACRGNPGPGAYGCLVQDSNGKILFEHAETKSMTTNNKMELQGVIQGLELLQSHLDNKLAQTYVVVVTDSRYVVDGITKWVKGWKSRGWKKADKKAPENLEYWKNLDQLVTQFNTIEFQWVKGHAGHPQNEYCDTLANKALDHEGF